MNMDIKIITQINCHTETVSLNFIFQADALFSVYYYLYAYVKPPTQLPYDVYFMDTMQQLAVIN